MIVKLFKPLEMKKALLFSLLFVLVRVTIAQSYLPLSGGTLNSNAIIGLYQTYNYNWQFIGGYIRADQGQGLLIDSRRWDGTAGHSRLTFGQDFDNIGYTPKFIIRTDYGGGPNNGNFMATVERFKIDVNGNVSFNNNASFYVSGPATFASSVAATNALFSGNVGIGTSSPTEKLSVNGNIRSQKVIVTQSGWSDYVFNKEYKLKSLISLEKYIHQNKHLPEVPNTEEIETNGISVGDNQALLLKKIEELTLYLIEMNKKVTSQDNKIRQLQKKLALSNTKK
jgi:hypothetical protein